MRQGNLRTEIRVKDLNTVKNYYHKRLFDHPEALEYLRKRGFKNTEHYERFQIGFSDGCLNLVTGESQRHELTEAGIFNEHERAQRTFLKLRYISHLR